MTKIDMIFGSTSDESKVMPGVIEYSKANPDADICVHWASADNTPDKVDAIMNDITKGTRRPMPLISGAGMSNVLTGVVKQYAEIDDLVIGIPIFDEEMHGLSSILSTGEKPPRNPVLAVPLNGSYTAANIAYKFLKGGFDKVCVPMIPELPQAERHCAHDFPKARDEMLQMLGKYGIEATAVPVENLKGDELVISPFCRMTVYGADRHIRQTDRILSKGKGIQIAVAEPGYKARNYDSYAEYFNPELRSTGYVTAGQYLNAVMVAAQILGHKDALNKIGLERADKARKLADEPMHAVKKGVVTKTPYKRI